MTKTYPLVDMSKRPPIEFMVGDQKFHVPRKARPDVAVYLASSVQLNDNGDRIYPDSAIHRAILDILATEMFIDGEWTPVDDKQRMLNLIRGERTSVDADVLGEIIMDITEALTADPTGGSNESSAGPSATGDGSTDSAGSASGPEATTSPTP